MTNAPEEFEAVPRATARLGRVGPSIPPQGRSMEGVTMTYSVALASLAAALLYTSIAWADYFGLGIGGGTLNPNYYPSGGVPSCTWDIANRRCKAVPQPAKPRKVRK
jgi:hypothetical protein